MCEDGREDFVEVPDFRELTFFELPSDKKPERPNRLIKLPLELQMSNTEVIRSVVGLVISLCAFAVIGYFSYEPLVKGVALSCRPRGGELVSGGACHHHLYLGLFVFGGLSLSSYSRYRQAAAVYRRATRVEGPHLRLTRNSFWCAELVEPLRFEDVIEAKVIDTGQLTRMPRLAVDFTLKRPPALVDGRIRTVNTWRGEFPIFEFSARPYQKDGLVYIVGFLVERYKKEHPEPSLIKLS